MQPRVPRITWPRTWPKPQKAPVAKLGSGSRNWNIKHTLHILITSYANSYLLSAHLCTTWHLCEKLFQVQKCLTEIFSFKHAEMFDLSLWAQTEWMECCRVKANKVDKVDSQWSNGVFWHSASMEVEPPRWHCTESLNRTQGSDVGPAAPKQPSDQGPTSCGRHRLLAMNSEVGHAYIYIMDVAWEAVQLWDKTGIIGSSYISGLCSTLLWVKWKEVRLVHPALESERQMKALEAKCERTMENWKNQDHPKAPYFCLKRKAFLEIRPRILTRKSESI